MTTLSLVAPLLAALALTAIVTSAHRRLPPALATRFITVALVIATMTALPTATLLALAFLAHAPLVGTGFEWCAQAFGVHAAVPAWLGLAVSASLVFGTVRAVRVLRDHRRMRCDLGQPMAVVASAVPFAYTLPGRAGRIVISTALHDRLDERERRIVLAHERAHARHRHDRFLLSAELSAAVLPPLRALANRLAFSVERWADEAAVRACGGDRRLVATTLAKVALAHGRTPVGVAGFAGLGVAGRIDALLAPPVRLPARRHVGLLWTSLVVTILLAGYQLHHLERIVAALCGH